MKKEKVKAVEEVIDVVGDFGPGPMKQDDESFQPDDTFGMSFDANATQGDQPHLQLQDQAIMMPPQLGKIEHLFFIFFSATFIFSGQDENDSQQAAEAMIQLGYFAAQPPNQDESLDFDPNYDPSDFLIKKDTTVQPELMSQEQPQFPEPYEYAQASGIPEVAMPDEMQQQQGYYGSFAQQAFNVNDFGFQQPQTLSQEDYSQPQVQQPQPQLMNPSDGGGLADLEISDSDDDDDNNEEVNSAPPNPMDTSKEDEDGDGLWF